MIYQMQSVRSDRAGFECLGQLAKATRYLFAEKLELDMSRVSSFDTNMAAPLGMVLARATDKFNSVSMASPPIAVKEVLTNSQFLTHFRYGSPADASPAKMPFRRFRLSDEGAFEEYVHRMLTSKDITAMSEKVIQRFRQKVFEVYRNSVTHSESEIGVFVCGHSFIRDNRLHFTIADGGIGVRGAVRRYFGTHRISSVPALKWALESPHTTKRGHPGGLGLHYIKRFSTLNQGRFWIVSRFAFYEYHCGQETFEKMKSDFPGTAVTIEINTANTGRDSLSSEVP